MISEQVHIPVTHEDMDSLEKAGIEKRDLIEAIRRLARDMGEEMSPKVVSQSGLTEAELNILNDGGASGIEDGDSLASTRSLALAELQIKYKWLQDRALNSDKAAALLGISQSRVRQRAAPENRGLYSFTGSNAERLYPDWQFHNSKPIPQLRDLLAALSSDAHPVTVYRFMTTRNPDLVTEELDRAPSPRDWLIAGFNVKPILELVRDI